MRNPFSNLHSQGLYVPNYSYFFCFWCQIPPLWYPWSASSHCKEAWRVWAPAPPGTGSEASPICFNLLAVRPSKGPSVQHNYSRSQKVTEWVEALWRLKWSLGLVMEFHPFIIHILLDHRRQGTNSEFGSVHSHQTKSQKQSPFDHQCSWPWMGPFFFSVPAPGLNPDTQYHPFWEKIPSEICREG